MIFRRYDFDHLHENNVVVVEKTGDEEGFGSWALKKLQFERDRSSRPNEYSDEIDYEQEVIVLPSYNSSILPIRLDPRGRFRVRGIFVRSLKAWEVPPVDSESIRRLATGEE